jgi:superoxide dismutase, Cu-Zn family
VTRLPLAAADMIAADGRSVGTVVLTQTPEGVRLALALRDLPPGEHGFHLHAVGKCEPPSFTSAGAHFNPESKKHGFFARDGHHAGDMANILVPPGGALSTTLTNKRITLDRGKPNSVFQEGGTALIIHDKFDDYITDPIGNSGDRIACGVIK